MARPRRQRHRVVALGVARIPALAVRAVPSDVALLRLHGDDAAMRRVFAATAAGRNRPPAVDRLLAHLHAEARNLQP